MHNGPTTWKCSRTPRRVKNGDERERGGEREGDREGDGGVTVPASSGLILTRVLTSPGTSVGGIAFTGTPPRSSVYPPPTGLDRLHWHTQN